MFSFSVAVKFRFQIVISYNEICWPKRHFYFRTFLGQQAHGNFTLQTFQPLITWRTATKPSRCCVMGIKRTVMGKTRLKLNWNLNHVMDMEFLCTRLALVHDGNLWKFSEISNAATDEIIGYKLLLKFLFMSSCFHVLQSRKFQEASTPCSTPFSSLVLLTMSLIQSTKLTTFV